MGLFTCYNVVVEIVVFESLGASHSTVAQRPKSGLWVCTPGQRQTTLYLLDAAVGGVCVEGDDRLQWLLFLSSDFCVAASVFVPSLSMLRGRSHLTMFG